MFSLTVVVVGSGGSGGQWGATSSSVWIGGGGGGAGGYSKKTYNKTEIENLKEKTVSFIVGAAPGSTSNGNDSSFLTQKACGGKAGEYFITQSPGVGGTASGGDENLQGATGGKGYYYTLGAGATGWNINGTFFGGGGSGNSVSDPGLGKVGCVYIRYEF